MTMLGFSVDFPSALRLFFQRLFIARTPSMMASDEPTQLVPTAPAPSPIGALKRFPIMLTHRLRDKSLSSHNVGWGGGVGWVEAWTPRARGSKAAWGKRSSLLHFGRLRVLLVVDEVLGECVTHEFLGLVLHVGGDKGGETVRVSSVSPGLYV